MVVDGKECGKCLLDEIHEWSLEFDKRTTAESIGLLSTVKPATGDFKEGLKKVCEQKMKEALQDMDVPKQKQQTIEWLDQSIAMLEEFKSQVKSGKVMMTDGYYDDRFPVPQPEERTENNISLSIDYINTTADTPASKLLG